MWVTLLKSYFDVSDCTQILDYLIFNCLIFDLLMYTIFSSTHPPKTNNISSD